MQDLLVVEEDEIHGGPVAPGRYTLDVVGEGIAASRSTIEVLDGQETAVEILLRPGFPARITVGLGSSHPEANHGRLVLVDASGATVSDTWIWLSEQRTGRQDLWLAPGPYRFEFRLPDGSALEGLLEVSAGAPHLAELDLRL